MESKEVATETDPLVRPAAHEVPEIRKRLVRDREEIEERKLLEVMEIIRAPMSVDDPDFRVRLARALDQLEGLAAEDGAEGMLAVQMVGTHYASLECLRLAMERSQPAQLRQANLAQAQRLMNLYIKQLAALDKHRGKGQQKVTVEHVQVESGGKAIVGSVNTACRGAPSKADRSR